VVVTVLVVAYAVVPAVTRVVGAVGGYSVEVYEPKDEARQSWLGRRGSQAGLPPVTLEVVVDVLLFMLLALVWLALVPPGASRR
jgi:hypothetical protein